MCDIYYNVIFCQNLLIGTSAFQIQFKHFHLITTSLDIFSVVLV